MPLPRWDCQGLTDIKLSRLYEISPLKYSPANSFIVIIHESIKKKVQQIISAIPFKAIPLNLLNPCAISSHLISVRSDRIGEQPPQIAIGHGIKIISLSVNDLPSGPHGTHGSVIHRI